MEYEVRWSRSQKGFVWVDVVSGEETLCKETDGYAEVLWTDNEQGRLHVEVDEIVMVGDVLYAVQKPFLIHLPEGAIELPIADRARLCYRRSNHDWRVRDEDGTGKVTFVKAYLGQMMMDWHDKAAHLFHRGAVFLYDDVAYLTHR